MFKEKALGDAAWKDLAARNKVKDNGLAKALEKLKRVGEDSPEEASRALDDVDKLATALKKDKAVAAAAPVGKLLAEMLDAVAAARRDLAKAKAEQEKAQKAKAEAEKKAAADAARRSDGNDDDDEESPEQLTSKVRQLLKLVAKGETVHALLGKSGKQVVVMLSRKPIPPARRKMLADELGGGSTKYYPGTCSLEAGSTTFHLKSEVAGMSKLVKAALLQQTGLRLNKIKCRGEDGDDHDDDGDAGPGVDSAAMGGTASAAIPLQAPPDPGWAARLAAASAEAAGKAVDDAKSSARDALLSGLGVAKGVLTQVTEMVDAATWAGGEYEALRASVRDAVDGEKGSLQGQIAEAVLGPDGSLLPRIDALKSLADMAKSEQEMGLVDDQGRASLSAPMSRNLNTAGRWVEEQLGSSAKPGELLTPMERAEIASSIGAQVALGTVGAEEVKIALNLTGAMSGLKGVIEAVRGDPKGWHKNPTMWSGLIGMALSVLGLKNTMAEGKIVATILKYGWVAAAIPPITQMGLDATDKTLTPEERQKRLKLHLAAALNILKDAVMHVVDSSHAAPPESASGGAPRGGEQAAGNHGQTASAAREVPAGASVSSATEAPQTVRTPVETAPRSTATSDVDLAKWVAMGADAARPVGPAVAAHGTPSTESTPVAGSTKADVHAEPSSEGPSIAEPSTDRKATAKARTGTAPELVELPPFATAEQRQRLDHMVELAQQGRGELKASALSEHLQQARTPAELDAMLADLGGSLTDLSTTASHNRTAEEAPGPRARPPEGKQEGPAAEIERLAREQQEDLAEGDPGLTKVDRNAARLLDLPEYQEGIARASDAYRRLSSEEATKTTAGTPRGEQSTSGWGDGKADATDRVRTLGTEAGHETEPHPHDQGEEGRYESSHAERQLAQASGEQSFGVSKLVCPACQRWFRSWAAKHGLPYFLADPGGVWVFMPDGRVELRPHD